MTGLIVLAVALALALAFGLYRRRTDGRVVSVSDAVAAEPRNDRPFGLDFNLGQRATLVQFSTEMCAPCRPTRDILASIAAQRPGVTHVDIDATERVDLVAEFDVRRTPTVLILDGSGQLRHRVTGVPKVADLEEALDELCAVRA